MTPFCRLRRPARVAKNPLKKLLLWCASRLDVPFSLDRANRNKNPMRHHNTYIKVNGQETSYLLLQFRANITHPTHRAHFGAPPRWIVSIFNPCVADTSENTPSERKQGKHQGKMPFTIKTYNTEFTCPICSDQRVVWVRYYRLFVTITRNTQFHIWETWSQFLTKTGLRHFQSCAKNGG